MTLATFLMCAGIGLGGSLLVTAAINAPSWIRLQWSRHKLRLVVAEAEDMLAGFRKEDDVSRETCTGPEHVSCFGRDGCEYR